jgi:hypothetical protein
MSINRSGQYDKPSSCDLREKMRGCGCTIEVTEWDETESVGIFGGYDDYVDYDYYLRLVSRLFKTSPI